MREVVIQVIILGVIKEEGGKDQEWNLPLRLFLMLIVNTNECDTLIVLNSLDDLRDVDVTFSEESFKIGKHCKF